jgi:hypothetical protein
MRRLILCRTLIIDRDADTVTTKTALSVTLVTINAWAF